jgi:hypothetical protein
MNHSKNMQPNLELIKGREKSQKNNNIITRIPIQVTHQN